MRCNRCGREVDSDSRFCAHCGQGVSGQPASRRLPERPAPAEDSKRKAGCPWSALTALGIGLGCLGLVAVGVALMVLVWRPWSEATGTPPSPVSTGELTTATESEVHEAPPDNPAVPLSEETAVTSEPSPKPPDAEADLAEYCRLLDEDRYAEAYALRSRRSRARTPVADFQKTWSNNRSIKMEKFSLVANKPGRMQAEVRLLADDVDAAGKSEVTAYLGKVDLVLEEGRWRYDGGDFSPLPGPGGTVEAFYKWYLAHQDRPFYRDRMAEVQDLFDPALYGHLVEAFQKGPRDGAWVDIDPFSDSQMGADGYAIRVRQVAGDQAAVDVTVTNRRGGTTSLVVHLEERGRWRVSDFEYSDAPTRLLPWLQQINGHD